MALLAAWTRWPVPWLLPATALSALPAIVVVRRRGGVPALGAVLVLFGTSAAFLGQHRLSRIAGDWSEIWEERETEVATRLSAGLEAILERGEVAVDAATDLPADPEARYRALQEILEESGLAALAVYGPPPASELVVWAGTHRGRVPETVRLGESAYSYGERPLFSYLYFTAPVPGTGGTAVAAALLRADLPPTLEADPEDFAARFRRETGETLRITRAERAAGEAIWDFRTEEGPLFSVSIVPPTQTARRNEVLSRWGRVVAGLAVAAWVLLAAGLGGSRERAAGAAATLVTLMLLLPFGRLLGLGGLFGPAEFLLPGPLEVTLGRLLALGVALSVSAGLLLRRVREGSPLLATAVVGVAFPLVVVLYRSGASAGLVAGAEERWVAFQASLAFFLILLAGGALHRAVGGAGPRRAGLGLTLWLLAAGVLAAALAVSAQARAELSPLWAVAWAVPATGVAWSLGRWDGWRRAVFLWAAAVVLGGTASLPFAWASRIEGRMEVAEVAMGELGAQADPYLEFLLHRLGDRVRGLWAEGAEPLEVLYRGWVESGLAEEGFPAWLTLWSRGNLLREELPIGVTTARPPVVDDLLGEAREGSAAMVRRVDLADARYVALIPLAGGDVVTVVVPPRRELGSPFPLGPLFGTPEAGDGGLTLVPFLPGERPLTADTLHWTRTDGGWRAERTLDYPDATYHAHYTLELPDTLLLVARATLLLVLDMAVLVLLLGAGRLLVYGGWPPAPWGVLSSFRARVTATFFGFFLLAVAIFGTLAYRTLSGAAIRTAELLAERVVEEGAEWYLEVQGSMALLARRVGAELLEYREGALRDGSVEELVELGLYPGWVPYPIQRTLETREALFLSTASSLGRWEYVVAYRRLPDGDVLASQVPLEAGATAVRRREVADLLGFAVVLGAFLSLGLALLVGRALSRPIHTLQVASERVGAGNLRVRLPAERRDEFGAVFRAFNRMVTRLRRARRDLVRTSRRTQAIVEEAATGVIALDPVGRVTLANPRAESFLDQELRVGESLPRTKGAAGEFVRWMDLYFRDGLREAGTELQFGERRIRVRARRISRRGPLGGVVISLEDVTDELRSERILAWGEMAQQVAHEVKNPLTPIKLSVQHIQRAWDDRRPDFETILTRNIEAVLREIERLASIARSFSRFAAPGPTGETPVEAVRLENVVDDVLTLYTGGEGAIRFEKRISEGLPAVKARAAELKEVLVNLLENARAAIEEEGRVVVEAEETAGGVELRVRDDGSGIAPDLLPRIFEPQFSTRSTGAGLGLAIVRRLVESWEGTIVADSTVGEGTVMRIRLGRWEQENGGSVGSDDRSV